MSRRTQEHIEKRDRFLKDDHYAILRRLARVRVATTAQLHRLCDPLLGRDSVVVWRRLKRMEKHGLIQAELSRPDKGAFSSHFWRLAFGGLAALGREKEVQLLRRPRQHVLEYLLFRNEAWATFRADGWIIGGPEYVAERDHADYLALYVAWAKVCHTRQVAALKARRASQDLVDDAQRALDRAPLFAPKALTFDFIMRRDALGVPTELVVFAIDDPRASVRTQLDALPLDWPPGTRLLLRDHKTTYDGTGRSIYRKNKRLHDWELALAKRYSPSTNPSLGQVLYDTAVLTAPPVLACPKCSTPVALDTTTTVLRRTSRCAHSPCSGEVLLDPALTVPLYPALWHVRTAVPQL